VGNRGALLWSGSVAPALYFESHFG
jgi:hypothetical protein